MKRIRINVSKPYEVIIDGGIIYDAPDFVGPVCETNRIAIVTDDIVDALYSNILTENLKSAGFEVHKFVIRNGEISKNFMTLKNILEFLAINKLNRNDALIALGGGVVGDIAGLAAAMYMRGIKVIQIPTTLLSMVDSSVGGKTAVDLKNGKNMAGMFWQPVLTICDIDIAEKLPEEIFDEGMAEVIKCNIIKKLPGINYIHDGVIKEHILEVVEDCIELKRDIVEQDEFDDKGIRNILNVGHTVAHAIEKLSDYSISHGKAVGQGLITEAQIAYKLGICTKETVDEIIYAVNAYDLTVEIPWDKTDFVDAMRNDKKNRDSKIVFELPHTLGNCVEHRLNSEELLEILLLL